MNNRIRQLNQLDGIGLLAWPGACGDLSAESATLTSRTRPLVARAYCLFIVNGVLFAPEPFTTPVTRCPVVSI